jgi:hypothetical protein
MREMSPSALYPSPAASSAAMSYSPGVSTREPSKPGSTVAQVTSPAAAHVVPWYSSHV